MKLKIVIIILVAVMLISGCLMAWSLGLHHPSSYSDSSFSEQLEWFTHTTVPSNSQHHAAPIEK